jgi:protein-S-isoprenylcysteine O-methyltransferase Ste14
MIWGYLIEVPWIVFAVYWAISALKTRRTVRSESFSSRLALSLMMAGAFFLIFSHRIHSNALSLHVFPPSYALAIVAGVLTWIGIAIAIWARWHLGENWSGRITLKENHELIRTGPYAFFRHPIYSGIDLAALGGMLAINRWRAVAGFLLIVVTFWIKAKKEERMLSEQFGEDFAEHQRKTGFLLPKFQ